MPISGLDVDWTAPEWRDHVVPQPVSNKPYVTLEDPDTRRFAQEDPRGFLKGIEGGAIVDEIQRAPQIPSYL